MPWKRPARLPEAAAGDLRQALEQRAAPALVGQRPGDGAAGQPGADDERMAFGADAGAASRAGACRGVKRGAKRASVISRLPPLPGALRTSKPAAASPSAPARATLQVAAVAPGAARRAIALKHPRLPHRRVAVGREAVEVEGVDRATISGSQSATSPSASSSCTRPPRSPAGAGRASAAARPAAARRPARAGASRRARAPGRPRDSGCFSIEMKCSRSQRSGSLRQASQVARKLLPRPKPVSSTTKRSRPRQRTGSPLPCRKTCAACASAPARGW